MINSLGLKAIIRPNKNKKAKYAITIVSLKDIYKIIDFFDKLPYEGYLRNMYKHVPTDSYFYLSIQIDKFMMRLSLHVGPVRTQMTNTKNMNNSETSMKKIPNLHVCSMGEG